MPFWVRKDMVKYLKSSVIRRTHIALCDIINNVFSWKTCNDAGLACAVVAAYHALHAMPHCIESY